MTQKLTILVTCTDRKTLRPDPDCQARSLPAFLPLHRRHQLWCDRLAAATPRRPVQALYAGEAWSRTRHLMAAAVQAGFRPQLWVASAGLGLVPADLEVPAYAATFSPGHADTVAGGRAAAGEWWRQFAEFGEGRVLAEVAHSGSVLVVASATYADALRCDLEQVAAPGGDVLVVGGVSHSDGPARLAPDLGLRQVLGGTATSLNLRMAEAWLQDLDQPRLTDARRRQRWDEWAIRERHMDRPERQPVSDGVVVDFIRALRSVQPRVGYSTALKQFRATGRACEQRRFATLFATAVTS